MIIFDLEYQIVSDLDPILSVHAYDYRNIFHSLPSQNITRRLVLDLDAAWPLIQITFEQSKFHHFELALLVAGDDQVAVLPEARGHGLVTRI